MTSQPKTGQEANSDDVERPQSSGWRKLLPTFDIVGGKERGKAIVPSKSVASRTLIIVVAIMSFLACLSFGVVTLVWESATGWQNDIAREVTVQVRPVDDTPMTEQLDGALELIQNTPGILDAQIMSTGQAERLLEPWLGTGLDIEELPVPRLIVIELDPNRPANLAGLAERLEANVAGASLDDHRIWISHLTTMANASVFIGVTITALVVLALLLSVTFATHGAVSGAHEIVEVLHFVGAKDGFIADQFQKHFLLLGLKGGALGGGLAILCFASAGFLGDASIGTAQGDQLSFLFGRFGIGLPGYIGTFLIILLIAILTAITSRIVVFQYLTRLK